MLKVVKFLFAVFPFVIPAHALADDKTVQFYLDEGKYSDAVELALASNEHYLGDLIARARESGLSSTPVWRALVHYKPALFGGQVSLVDGADFFLADDGNTNPAAELEATIAGFFSRRPIEPTRHSAQCKFVARYRWLKSQLDFDPARLPEEKCEDYELYLRLLSPESLTVVFPTTHPGSPSSMFGHTLLRVNKKGWTEQTRMLNYSINFAAQVPPDIGAFSYTTLGLGGGFKGQYGVLPYYSKLREYAQMENRDIWEYSLNLDPEQVDLVVQHVYELAPTYFDYYFFTENCSYHLLSLLDIVFPERPLTDEFKTWTIPVDTVRILENRGLISGVKYYPSSARVIGKRRENLSDADNVLALSVFEENWETSQSRVDALPTERQAVVLDLLNDYYRYDKLKNSESSDGSLNKVEKLVLAKRAKLKLPSQSVVVPPPTLRPDKGHRTARLGAAAGVTQDNTRYTEFSWRPAYHDLLDSSNGYVPNSALEFMDVRFRYTPDAQDLQLNSVTVLDIVSLEPRDDFFNNFSWRVRTGWSRAYAHSTNAEGAAYVDAGGGLSYRIVPGSDNTLLYGFIEADLGVGDALAEKHRLGAGYSIGLIGEPINKWRVNAQMTYRNGVVGDLANYYVSSVGQSLRLTRNLSVQLIAEQINFDTLDPSASASLYYYF